MFDGLDAVVFKPKDGKDRPGLYLEEASRGAARYAIQNWHYSQSLPGTDMTAFGCWENGGFIGVVTFSFPAGSETYKRYGVENNECLELTRVALRPHHCATTKAVSVAVRLMKKANPTLRVLVSYADTRQGHLGIIYQAMNWTYEGVGQVDNGWALIHGELIHGRRLYNLFGTRSIGYLRDHVDSGARYVTQMPKHRYSYAIDRSLQPLLEAKRKPYPTSVGSAAVGTVSVQETSDGPNPIPTLHEQTRGGDLVSRR